MAGDVDLKRYTFFGQLINYDFVEGIWLYGSRARGDNIDRSDIDIAVFCPKATSYQWHLVLEIIEKADTLLKIDCVRLDALSSDNSLRKAILSQGICLYKRSNV